MKRTRNNSNGYVRRTKYRKVARGSYPVSRVQPRGRFANSEKKFLDTTLTGFGTITAAMEFLNLNIIVQGNTESNRIGRKTTLSRVDVKGHLLLPTTAVAANTNDTVRIMLVCDKQTNGAQFTATDLLETDSIGQFRNLANSSRFTVLQTKTFDFNCKAGSGRGSTDTLSYGEDGIWFTMGVNLNLPIEFNNIATTGAVTTQRSNSLWIVTQSVSGLVGLNLGTARIRFSDL